MAFTIKPTKRKKESVNRSIYLSKEVHDKVLKIAAENDTSFSNVVVSMIEYCRASRSAAFHPKAVRGHFGNPALASR